MRSYSRRGLLQFMPANINKISQVLMVTSKLSLVDQLLDDNPYLIQMLATITNQSLDLVQKRLDEETNFPGSNERGDFILRRITPHCWSHELSKFYSESDAFLYRLIVWNRNPIKQNMRSWIGNYLRQMSHPALEILCLGDGGGFDSISLAQAGYAVTYHDYPGFTETFARRIFADAGLKINLITDARAIPRKFYDVVICLDVLEHVPSPPEMVAAIADYLKPGGRAIIHAPFYAISPKYLTHLEANRKYSGKLNLFTEQGLRLMDGRIGWNPLVFQKETAQNSWLNSWHPWLGILQLMGFYMAVVASWKRQPFPWVTGDRPQSESINQNLPLN